MKIDNEIPGSLSLAHVESQQVSTKLIYFKLTNLQIVPYENIQHKIAKQRLTNVNYLN